jgi:hypothetical protein
MPYSRQLVSWPINITTVGTAPTWCSIELFGIGPLSPQSAEGVASTAVRLSAHALLTFARTILIFPCF